MLRREEAGGLCELGLDYGLACWWACAFYYLSPITGPPPLQSKGLAKAGRLACDLTGENELPHC